MGQNDQSKPRSGATAHTRPSELEDWLNGRLYHPLSMILARSLVPTPVTPNMVSIAGGLMIVLAAIAYNLSDTVFLTLFALLLHMGWHVLDGADGDLARLTGRMSSTGEVIDGICDYLGHIILYVSLAYMMADHIGWAAWGWAVAAGAGRIVQAAHYEVQRRQYQHWVYGTAWLRVSSNREAGVTGVIGFFARCYVGLAALLAPGGRRIDDLVEQSGEQGRVALRAIIREETKPVLRSTYLLSANYRTIALGLSMLAGSPVYFFAFEAIFLTVVMIVSIFTAYKVAERIQNQAKSLR